MTSGMELYQLLEQAVNEGKAKGKKPGDMIEELPQDEEKKKQLRELLRYILEGPSLPDSIQWKYE